MKLKWVRDEAGEDKRVEGCKRVRKWWRVGEPGTVTPTRCYGSKLIEFEPGKKAIGLNSAAEWGPVLEQVKRAVLSGERGQQFAAQADSAKAQA